MTVLERLREFSRQTNVASKSGVFTMTPLETYSLERSDDGNAEMSLYGDIVDTKPRDYEGEEVEGNFIVMNEVIADLKELKAEGVKNLTIHIHSFGGSSACSTVIYNKLRDLGAQITCIVDGVAMSGGSVILCAADSVQVNKSSIVMIHNCWTCLFGGYNIAELQPVINSMEATNQSMVNIYTEKTGRKADEIREMLAAETYMVGQEIIDEGFADELIEDKSKTQIAASADRKALFVRGIPVWVADGRLPKKLDGLPVMPGVSGKSRRVRPAVPDGGQLSPTKTADEANKTTEPNNGKGGNEIMAKTVEELKKEYPDLCKQLIDETKTENEDSIKAAVKAERERIEGIDNIASNVLDQKMVEDAKYGDKPMTAQELAFEVLKTQKAQGSAYLANQNHDAETSGVDNVETAEVPSDETETPEDVKAQAKADVEKFMPKKEGK